MLDIPILDCGRKDGRVAKPLLAMGARVTATTRYRQWLAGRGAEIIGAGRPMPRFPNNRRVDGSAIRKALCNSLTYPSYHVGIPAAPSGATTNASSGHSQI